LPFRGRDGFAKNERDNIGARELADLKVLAGRFLGMTEAEIELALRENELKELACDDQTQATRN
jgi:hypothetical protein